VIIDHRRLGRELDYFHSDPLVGAGLPIWLPSLCPHHAMVFASRGRSYRDLPLRVAELGPMYREERSGVLGGLSRVRAVSLNDAHIFCAEEQAVDEIRHVFRMMHQAHEAVGMKPARYRLSLPSDGKDKYAAHEGWQKAADMLREGLGDIPFEEAPGEAAFYGPKIDVQIADPAGREQTLSTVQIDYFQPERFGLTYVDSAQKEQRPVIVHRSLLGSMERLVAHLLEVHNGWLPDWCAPVQVVVLPVRDHQLGAARELQQAAMARGLRAELWADGSLGARVRRAAERRVSHVAVIGEQEAAVGAVALRGREPQPVDIALEILVDSCEVPLKA
jgi:threonyl-tRNA synthetase